MSTTTDDKLLSLLHQITSKTDLDLSKSDESHEIENAIAEENAYSKKRSQEFLLTEMEQKLEIAEINFGTLKQQLDYMKMLYTDIHRESDKLDKHRKDRHKKRPQNKIKNISKTLPLRRRFSSASVHKARSAASERLKSLKSKTVTYTSSAINTEDVYIAPEPQSAKSKNKSPRNAASETQQNTTPNEGTSNLEEFNPEPAPLSSREEENNLFQMVCNQGQQTEPLEVVSTQETKQDFWYGYAEDANQMLEQCVHMSEKFIKRNKEQEKLQEQLSCEPTEEEIQYTLLISGNSRNSTNNSCRTSGKREAYCKHMHSENPKRSNKKPKGKAKISGSLSSTFITDPNFEGPDASSKTKRKPKSHGVNTEKKRKSVSKTSIHTRHIKPHITETVVSVTTKTNTKKPSKMKLFSSKSTVGNKKDKIIHSCVKVPEEQPDIPVPLKPNNNLVELYHNENMNINISEENVPESARKASNSSVLNVKNDITVPPESSQKKLTTRRTNRKEHNDVKRKHNEPAPLKESKPIDIPSISPVPIQEEKETSNVLEETKTVNSNEPDELPKGPTRFKYFKRNYYKRLNFKKIPFVAGTSTSPSHNLGLNIQQVLSIFKMKQPCFKENTEVVDSSTLIQQTFHRRTRSLCPARMHNMLTHDPEQDISNEADVKNAIAPNATNGILIGLTNRIRRPEDVWVVDQDNAPKKPKCSCVPTRRCTDYQQLLIEYLERGGGDVSFLNRKYSSETYPHLPSAERRFRSHFSAVDKTVHQDVPWDMEQSTISDNNKQLGSMNLTENGFHVKGVLSRLQDDFNRLNTQYKQLKNGLNKDMMNKEKKLELQKLEKALQAKEHEINMIKDLNKEVNVLKQHMKSLRMHNDHSNFSISSPPKLDSIQYFGGKGPTPSLRLTKLLRIMQQFQYRLRKVSDKNSRGLCFYHCTMINIE